LVRLAGLEPAAGCLEGTASLARTGRDVHSSGLMTRYRSGRTGAAATEDCYKIK